MRRGPGKEKLVHLSQRNGEKDLGCGEGEGYGSHAGNRSPSSTWRGGTTGMREGGGRGKHHPCRLPETVSS